VVRDKAVALTGLKWSKIYKWLFDQGDKLPSYRRHLDCSSTPDYDLMELDAFRSLTLFETIKV